jgi:Peptidase family M48
MGSVQQLGQAFYNHYNQSQELAADAIGLQYAAAAGYDPRVGALLFERMAIEVPQSLTAGFFSSHPSSLERVDAAQKRINVLIAQGYGVRPISSPVAAIASGTVPPPVPPPVVSSGAVVPVAQPSISAPVQTFVPVSYVVPNAITPTAANRPTMYNDAPAADTQLRNLDWEFRAGRIGIDEYRQMKKVLTGE